MTRTKGMALAFSEVLRQPAQNFASRLILLTDGHTLNVSECYDWAEKARQAGLKLTTMGIGVEFNEDLLIPQADLTGGSAYYIESPDRIPGAFRQELGAATRITYRNVEVKLQLPANVELRRVYRVLPELGEFDQGPEMDRSYALVGTHASGSNSGVPHAGFSYSPDGLKAKFTKLVRGWMTAYCERNQIPINRCGKLVSAKDERDLPPLDERPPRKSCDQSQNR